LGISHVDPIKYNIKFARFLNEFRNTLPDIDFDFPHNLRDEVFLQINTKWPGQIARISNHVYFHKKSALREAVRKSGLRKMIPSLEIYNVIKKLPLLQQKFISSETKRLQNKFRTYSLHCGGIVFYPKGVPDSLKLKSKKSPIMSQIILNKKDIAKDKNFKIDILSSRCLTQLYEACNFTDIDFEKCINDNKTANLFTKGDNIGITLAESPLIRKSLMKIQPKSVDDIAKCLAIIRPAAREARFAVKKEDLDTSIIYEDDVIDLLSKYLNCSEAEADKYRRAICKDDKNILFDLQNIIKDKKIIKKLKSVRKYGFCKAHAYSYAQLVWNLGYIKAHNPKKFWEVTLKHCHSSYRKWVHIYEAQLAGVDIENTINIPHKSIYAMARNNKKQKDAKTIEEQMKLLGYWKSTEFYPNCYCKTIDENKIELNGLIANSRVISYDKKDKKAVLYIGYEPHKYIEIIISGKHISYTKKTGIKCIARYVEQNVYETKQNEFQFW
jgi:DNA polymerase III alpha subunit